MLQFRWSRGPFFFTNLHYNWLLLITASVHEDDDDVRRERVLCGGHLLQRKELLYCSLINTPVFCFSLWSLLYSPLLYILNLKFLWFTESLFNIHLIYSSVTQLFNRLCELMTTLTANGDPINNKLYTIQR